MILLTLMAGVMVGGIGGWLAIEATRQRWWMWAAIPALLTWPMFVFFYGSSLLGYATDAPLPAEFQLVSSYADEKRKTIFALVKPKGEDIARFYAVTGDFEANRKSFAKAQTAVGKGIPIAGKQKREGLQNEGDFVWYQLPPAGLPDKG